MPMTNKEFNLKRKSFNALTDSLDGLLVFDPYTHKIYLAGDCFSSNIKDVSFNQTTGVITLTKMNGTEEVINLNLEKYTNKVTSISDQSTDDEYPSAKCIYETLENKGEIVWEAQSVEAGILASETDLSQSPTWQLTNLDMTPYQTVYLYVRSGGTGADTTASGVIRINLASMNLSPFGYFIGSTVLQNPNNRNRLLALSVAVSKDKTKVLFNRCTSLYNTAASNANTDGRVLYKIVGYRGTVSHSYQIVGPSEYTGKNFFLRSKYDNNPVTSQWSIISGGSYATINQWGRVDIEPSTVQETIVVQSTYNGLTDQKTIEISYDNQLVIQGPDTITGTSGSVVALYNNSGCVPVWSIISGGSNATINEYGEITIIQSGDITIQAVYNGLTTTKQVSLTYQAGTTQETVINPDGSVTETTTTETTDPQTGTTTTEITSTTTNEDGSQSNTTTETETNSDGSSTSTSTTTNSDGTSSETESSTSAPDPQTGSVTTESNTTNYDENGDVSGSSENTTVENTDGSSSSTTTNYNVEGDPINTTNENIDSSGNNSTQEIEYDEQGNGTVTEYTIDTSGNPEGEKTYEGDGEDTEFLAFKGDRGFVLHINFKAGIADQPNPPIVPDPTDKSRLYTIVNLMEEAKPWPGIVLRFSSRTVNLAATIVYIDTSNKARTVTHNITKTSDDVYDLTITYDPNAASGSNNITIYDNLTRRQLWGGQGTISSHDLSTTIGYSYYPAGGYNYRFSKMDLYNFSITKL